MDLDLVLIVLVLVLLEPTPEAKSGNSSNTNTNSNSSTQLKLVKKDFVSTSTTTTRSRSSPTTTSQGSGTSSSENLLRIDGPNSDLILRSGDSTLTHSQEQLIIQESNPRGGGGVLRFGSDGGVPLKPPNPYLSLRVILAEKGTHY